MNASDQATRHGGKYLTVPRTLILATSENPATGVREVLLLKGGPEKRLWADLYNGLGGHVEADEDVAASAQRELMEEAGLDATRLALRGVVNVDTGVDADGRRPGVIMFVFHAEVAGRDVTGSAEGTPEWIPLEELDAYPLVDDLYQVIPLTVAAGGFFFGHYTPDAGGRMQYRFTARVNRVIDQQYIQYSRE